MDLIVNGAHHQVESSLDRPLLWVLRDELDLTGAKYGCGEGQCGACTILLDGVALRSCLTPLRAAQGKEITTVEGLEKNGTLHPLQEAFIEHDAMQCGYCTAGMLMSSAGLLKRKPDPAVDEIKSALQGNLCRCGTYPRIVEAVRMAARNGGKHA